MWNACIRRLLQRLRCGYLHDRKLNLHRRTHFLLLYQ